MIGILSTLFLIGITGIWAVAFFYLGINIQRVNETIALGVLGVSSFLGGIYGLWSWWRQRTYEDRVNLLDQSLASVGPNIEFVMFNKNGKILWSTHSNVYPNEVEFTRRILSRVSDSEERQQIRYMIENRQRGEILFRGGGNGLGQDQKWWLFTLSNVDKGNFFVILRNLTSHLEGYAKLKSSYHQLQNFVDTAPFGVLYSSRQGVILGLNQTLCTWLDLPRDELIGRPVTDFIKDAESYQGTVRVFNRQGPTFKALLFKSTDSSSRTSPSILCRLDGVTSLAASDLTQDVAFLDAPIPAMIVNQSGEIVSVNTALAVLLGGLKPKGKLSHFMTPSFRNEVEKQLQKAFQSKGALAPFELRFDEDKFVSMAYVSRPFERGEHREILIQFIDVSEQKRLQDQFIQSQKMQAVGQLAGGIAHDFNNLLTAMIGYCDLLLQRYLPNNPSYNDVVQIKQNANRAANLVRQLLAFSRQQNLQPKVVNVTDHLVEISTLLRRLIGARIELKMFHGRDLWFVKVDVSQLEQVIINLAVNARDAMGNGGILTIKTSNYQVMRPQRMGHDIIPKGEYVSIEVIDTGCGIPPEHLDYIFEPFFSTKEVGKGTGLGLSTVYGILKQTGGFVLVQSNLGEGTTFRMLLPRHMGGIEQEVIRHDTPLQDLTGGGRILLVEDEDPVRVFSARALREKGYTVLEATNGEMALEMVNAGEKFDLLITDVVMPRMDGPTLNKKIRDKYPHAKTIFISGYTEDTFRKNLGNDAKIHFLPKPYTLKELAAKVKEVVGEVTAFEDE